MRSRRRLSCAPLPFERGGGRRKKMRQKNFRCGERFIFGKLLSWKLLGLSIYLDLSASIERANDLYLLWRFDLWKGRDGMWRARFCWLFFWTDWGEENVCRERLNQSFDCWSNTCAGSFLPDIQPHKYLLIGQSFIWFKNIFLYWCFLEGQQCRSGFRLFYYKASQY